MKRITILSKDMFNYMMNYTHVNDSNVEKTNVGYICINNPGVSSFFDNTHSNVINLNFDDITLEDFKLNNKDMKKRLILFTNNMANNIKNFVDANKDKEEWIIHCVAGISRSGAIGLWLNDYLAYDYDEFFNNNPYIYPNLFVYDKMVIACL